jgi:LuxR family maltose regulon positive regulatory protein
MQALGSLDGAQEAFYRALTLAEPGGYARLFIEEGERIVPLLRNSIARGTNIKFATNILNTIKERYPKEVHLTQQPLGLMENLTERELEVLRHMRSSLAVPEIACQLYVADSTVRSHIKSIYAKLGVHRRMEAVQRAEDIGLFKIKPS